MKTIRTIVFFIIAIIEIVIAQADTTDWFPMQTGNYWEYMAWTGEGPKYFSIKVIGDTLMPNGKEYKIFSKKYFSPLSNFTWYLRKDSNKVYEFSGDSITCLNLEYLYLDFIIPDSSIWLNCTGWDAQNARGIISTFTDYTYYTFLQKPNAAKQFEDVRVDSADTVWSPTDGSLPIVINKGLGIVWHFIFNDGSYYLQGVIINGVQMGVITNVEKNKSTVPYNFSLKSYPNPFNNSTTFDINLPETDQTELSIYNILGQKIATLIDEQKSAGNFNIQFNANHLSSGVYFAVLRQNELYTKEKIILLK